MMDQTNHVPGDLNRIVERHSVLIMEHSRRLEELERGQRDMISGFAILNQAIGELKSEIKVRFDEAKERENDRKQLTSILWGIIFLILTQVIIAGFELMKMR